MPDTKSNAAREIAESIYYAEPYPHDCVSTILKTAPIIESALASAQSSLAKQVLEEMSTMAGGNHGGGLIVVSRDAAVERLRDLFSRLNIRIEE